MGWEFCARSLPSLVLKFATTLIKKNRFTREFVRSRRLGGIHPSWAGILAQSGEYWETAKSQANGAKVLFATSLGSSGWGAVSAMESMLGTSLTLRAANVHYLLCDGALPACMECDSSWYRNELTFARQGPDPRHCDSCYRPAAVSFGELGLLIHRYSNFLTDEDYERSEQISQAVPYHEIHGFSEDGIAIGEHAMAGALRFYARATLSDPYAEPVLRRYLKASLLTAWAVRKLFLQEQFDVVVTHHGIYVPQGLAAEVARSEGIRVVTWHTAYRTKTFIFSHDDTYHHTFMDEPTDRWETMHWSSKQEQRILGYLASRAVGNQDWISFVHKPQAQLEPIMRELGFDPTKPTVGMLTNVMWDAQLHYPANAFPNMLDWVIKTVEYFRSRPEIQLVIRVHPAEVRGTLLSRQPLVEEIRSIFKSLPENVFVVPPESRISTYTVLQQCNAALIYGTKMGVELTSAGIPTIVAGEAWVRNKGLTIDANSQDEYFRELDQLPFGHGMDDATVQRARKYAYHFFFRRMIPVDLFEPHRGYPPFRPSFSSLAALLPGVDRGLDVICDGILFAKPFIYPHELDFVEP